MSADIVIWGAGGHAEVVADVIRRAGQYRIAGFIEDPQPERVGSAFCESTIIGTSDALADLFQKGVAGIVPAVGSCRARLRLLEMCSQGQWPLISAIHPSAILAASATVGEGTVITAGAIVNPGATIGRVAIINTGSTVDHHCVVNDGAHICPGVHLGGSVSVGRGSWVGIGAAVRDGITIGDSTYIGAGAVVVKSIPDGVTAYGNPARIR